VTAPRGAAQLSSSNLGFLWALAAEGLSVHWQWVEWADMRQGGCLAVGEVVCCSSTCFCCAFVVHKRLEGSGGICVVSPSIRGAGTSVS